MTSSLFARICGAASIALLLSTSVNAQQEDHDNGFGNRAVSLWWLIFNNPENCIENPGQAERCGPNDVFGPAYVQSLDNGTPDPSLISPNLASGVAVLFATGGETSFQGGIRMVASIYRSPEGVMDIAGGNVVDPLGLARGFENPNAEVHLVVRDHGLAEEANAALRTQILNFLEPFCSDPTLDHVAGPNLCIDSQFAQFAPNESGGDALFAFHDTSHPVFRAQAHLFRNGDMLQAVVETRVTAAP